MGIVNAGSLETEAAALDVSTLYRQHGDFVYKTLARFGVPEDDRPDQVHEVFVVVHRQLAGYRRDAAITTWLFAIARRVAAGYKRRAYRVREQPTADPTNGRVSEDSPEDNVERRRAKARMDEILDRMSLDQRAVFVMFEIDGMTGQEIADVMGCPLQTVFSRLRRARDVFERHVGRLRASEERRAS